MNRAEHSPQEHSAPHGAPRAANSTLSNCGSELTNALAVPTTSPAPARRRFLIRLSQRRSTSSGRALLAILALGLILDSGSGAYASQPSARAGQLYLVASTKVAASKAATPARSSEKMLSAALQSQLAEVALSKQTRLPVAPRAALMPRAGAFSIPRFPSATPVKTVASKPQTARPSNAAAVAGKKAALSPVLALQPGTAKLVRVAQVASVKSASARLAPSAPADKPDLGGMKKVIDVPSLTLPPLSKPLPTWMQNAAVKVDKIGAAPKRLAQNPSAPPIRNPSAPVTNSDRLPNQIEVAVSTFVVLMTTTDLQTVAVADPNIADVAVVNSRSVLLNGKTAGVTSLVIVDGQKIRQYSVRVTAAPGSRPVDVASAIGLPGVTVRPIRDALVLEGEVASAEEARRAVEIAEIYSTKVVNQMTIRGQVSQEAGTAAQLRDLIGLPNISVRVMGDTAVLSGTVDTPQQITDADTIARTVSKNVINQLRLPALSVDQVRESLGAAPTGSETAGPVAPGTFVAPSPLVVREAGGTIVLEGTADSQATLDQALALAGRTGLAVVNRVQVAAAPTADQGVLSGVAAAIGRPGVRVSGSAKRLILEGTVANTEEAVAVEQIARAFSTQVDNLLQTPNPRLVDVDVSIVEITKTGLKNLGFTFPSLLDTSASGFVLGQRSTSADLPGPLPTQGTGSLVQQTAFQAALRAQIQNEDVRLLSNPRTTVLSGRTATFQVGGQVPVPISITQSATGTITGIAFKDFGVLVDVVPNASANGAVTMRVKTEISQPDETIGFTPFAGASVIPGFQRRAAVTEVTTPAGGTVALGGLISNEARTLITKVPVLSKIPILGSLFTSKRFQNDQTELVIFVTPRLLPNPLAEGTTAAAGVVAVGNTTNVGTVLGNPGLNTGGIVTGASTAGGQ